MLADAMTLLSKVTHEEVVQRARDLVPMLRERAAETERARDVPLDILDAIEQTGMARCLTPERWGGNELGFRTVCETVYELAKGCASTAWCTQFLSAHAWVLFHFEEQAQAEVFGSGPDARLGGVFAPMGKAKPVEGGFRLSGRWPWSSGVAHCPWMVLGSFIEGPSPPELHVFLVGPGDFTWEDTWQNAGLQGTGSHDTIVQDVFIPAHRVVPWEWIREGQGAGVDSNPSPIYRTPLASAFLTVTGMLALGSVHGAYEYFRDWTKTRTSGVTGLTAAGHPALQIGLTETACEIDAAEMLLARCIDRMTDPDTLDYRLRVECKRDAAYAVQLLLRAIDRLMSLGSARAFFDGNPLQRAWRDVHALSSHFTMNFSVAGEMFGRLELGLEPPERDRFY